MNKRLALLLCSSLILSGCGKDNADTKAENNASESADAVQAIESVRTLLDTYNDAAVVTTACEQAIASARSAAESLKQSSSKTLLADWNQLSARFEDVVGPIYLQTYTHPDKAIRDAGEACIVSSTSFQTALFQDAALFEKVSAVEPADGIDAGYKQELIEAFEDTGVALPEKKRKRAKEILDLTQTLSQEFNRRLRENQDKLVFNKAEQKGLPESYLQRVTRDDNGNIVVGFNYPEVFPFLTHAEDEEARERYYRAFLNRGGDRNIDILDELVKLRKELAGLYDLPSYAHYVTQRRMVGNPETVHNFLDSVESVVREIEKEDLRQLRELKAQHIEEPDVEDVDVYAWDKEFYLERMKKARYDIDQEALRKYFPMPQAVDWTLLVTERLYGLEFIAHQTETWHEDVLYYDVLDADSKTFLGGLYLDLYPREGKYGHAAAFGARGGSTALNRLPVTALVTNFDRKGLTHRELETLLHEFGHALHGILSRTRYMDQSGTNVERDFVEAPSQMYEEWARKAESLQLMRKVCEACPIMDPGLIDRLDAANRLGKGLFYARQHLYASYDMALAGEERHRVLSLWEDMEDETAMGHADNTEFPGTFAHIAGGYAAGYYGYMWSEALALDMLSAFGDNLMNPDIGHQFREKVLARGGEAEPMQMVEDFLGRPTNPKAFFAEIRGNRK